MQESEVKFKMKQKTISMYKITVVILLRKFIISSFSAIPVNGLMLVRDAFRVVEFPTSFIKFIFKFAFDMSYCKNFIQTDIKKNFKCSIWTQCIGEKMYNRQYFVCKLIRNT